MCPEAPSSHGGPAKADRGTNAAVRAAIAAILVLAVGIGTFRVYDALRTPVGGFDGMIHDMRRLNRKIGPSLANAGYGSQLQNPQLQTREIAAEAGGRAVDVSRKSSLARTSSGPQTKDAAAGTPMPQGVVPGGEGEIELHNDTEVDATFVLAVSSAPDGILKSSSLPSGGGAVVRGLRPATYSLAVTFSDYPRSPVRLGPFLILQTVTLDGTVADRYEIHLRPAP